MKIKVISGLSHGIESPVRPLGGCWYFHAIFNKKASIWQDIRKLGPAALPNEHLADSSAALATGWTTFLYSASISSD